MTNFFGSTRCGDPADVFTFLYYMKQSIAGAIYTCTHRRRAYCCLAGFDPNIKALSPGTLLIAHTIDALWPKARSGGFSARQWAYKYLLGCQGSSDLPTKFFFAKHEQRRRILTRHRRYIYRQSECPHWHFPEVDVPLAFAQCSLQ